MADLHHLGRAEGRRRAADLLERFDLADAATQAGRHLLRRHAAPARPRDGRSSATRGSSSSTSRPPASTRAAGARCGQIIRDLVAGGVTVFLTTQYLEEADQLADRIAVLDHGRLVAEGTADELKRLVPGGHISLRFADAAALEAAAARARRGSAATTTSSTLQVPSDGGVQSLRDAARPPRRRGDRRSTSLSVHTPDLDDVFLALTGNAQGSRSR